MSYLIIFLVLSISKKLKYQQCFGVLPEIIDLRGMQIEPIHFQNLKIRERSCVREFHKVGLINS